MKINKLKIVLFGDPVLRETAKPVTVFHKKFINLVEQIKFTLDCHDDGAALAANQVGALKRLTVIDYENEYLELINPEIVEAAGLVNGYEGCLSFPGYTGLVPRSEMVVVKYLDRNGEEKIIERTGRMARCLQHEIDHLNGILFIDRMEEPFLKGPDPDTTLELEKVIELSNGNNPVLIF